MKSVIIDGEIYPVIKEENRFGYIIYKNTKCDICFRIEGYYIEYEGKIKMIEDVNY